VSFFLWIAIAAVIVVLGVLFLRKRKKHRQLVQSHRHHPTGFIQYHDHTKTVVKKTLNDKGSRSIAVLTFKGDIRASTRKSLSKLIDEVILNKERFDEVVVCIESPGGSVTDYGHVYSELCRLREGGLSLTACVDTVAASGGYLACLPATKILAAPFSMVGSIGVVSFVPNIRKLLQKYNIEPRTFTAGDFKRTVTMTDEATPEQVKTYQQQLELIHQQFKQAISRYRPQVDLLKVATGEAWLASTSVDLDLRLVDALRTSADYLLEKNQTHDLVEFSLKSPKKGIEKITQYIEGGFEEILNRI